MSDSIRNRVVEDASLDLRYDPNFPRELQSRLSLLNTQIIWPWSLSIRLDYQPQQKAINLIAFNLQLSDKLSRGAVWQFDTALIQFEYAPAVTKILTYSYSMSSVIMQFLS